MMPRLLGSVEKELVLVVESLKFTELTSFVQII